MTIEHFQPMINKKMPSETLINEILHSQAYRLAKHVEQSMTATLESLQIHPDDEHERYLFLYFQRLQGDDRALLLMAERGMERQMQIMLRAIIEICFDLKAFCNHRKVLDALVAGEDNDRRSILQNLYITQLTKSTLTTEELEQLKQASESADKQDRQDFHTVIKAEFAGMLHDYRTEYHLLSETIHCSIDSLKDDVTNNDQQDTVTSITSTAVNLEEMQQLILSSVGYMLTAYECLIKLLKLEHTKEEKDDLDTQLQTLWSRMISSVPHRK